MVKLRPQNRQCSVKAISMKNPLFRCLITQQATACYRLAVLSDPFFILVFTIFALDIVCPRLWQLRQWYVARYYEDEEEVDESVPALEHAQALALVPLAEAVE